MAEEKKPIRLLSETEQEELERLRKFQDEVFKTIDEYIKYYVSPKEYGVLRELRKDLWEKKLVK